MDDLLASIRKIMADESPADRLSTAPLRRTLDRSGTPPRPQSPPSRVELAMRRAFDPNLAAAQDVLSANDAADEESLAVFEPDAVDEESINAVPAPHRFDDVDEGAPDEDGSDDAGDFDDGMASIIPMRGPSSVDAGPRRSDQWSMLLRNGPGRTEDEDGSSDTPDDELFASPPDVDDDDESEGDGAASLLDDPVSIEDDELEAFEERAFWGIDPDAPDRAAATTKKPRLPDPTWARGAHWAPEPIRTGDPDALDDAAVASVRLEADEDADAPSDRIDPPFAGPHFSGSDPLDAEFVEVDAADVDGFDPAFEDDAPERVILWEPDILDAEVTEPDDGEPDLVEPQSERFAASMSDPIDKGTVHPNGAGPVSVTAESDGADLSEPGIVERAPDPAAVPAFAASDRHDAALAEPDLPPPTLTDARQEDAGSTLAMANAPAEAAALEAEPQSAPEPEIDAETEIAADIAAPDEPVRQVSTPIEPVPAVPIEEPASGMIEPAEPHSAEAVRRDHAVSADPLPATEADAPQIDPTTEPFEEMERAIGNMFADLAPRFHPGADAEGEGPHLTPSMIPADQHLEPAIDRSRSTLSAPQMRPHTAEQAIRGDTAGRERMQTPLAALKSRIEARSREAEPRPVPHDPPREPRPSRLWETAKTSRVPLHDGNGPSAGGRFTHHHDHTGMPRRQAAPTMTPSPASQAPLRDAVPHDDALTSETTRRSVNGSFEELSRTILAANPRTFEDLIGDLMRPMLREWLDTNLPDIVERHVRAEIEQLMRKGGR